MSSRLILYPVITAQNSGNISIPTDGLVEVLQDLGMISSAIDKAGVNRYLIGARFLQNITFMGCAPAIELAPVEDGSSDFCHLEIGQMGASLRFIADDLLANPRCTKCKQSISNWQEQMQDWRAGVDISCPNCGAKLDPQELNWRRAAGFVQQYVAIHGVYPKEALPTEALLNKLESAFACSWDYFYAR